MTKLSLDGGGRVRSFDDSRDLSELPDSKRARPDRTMGDEDDVRPGRFMARANAQGKVAVVRAPGVNPIVIEASHMSANLTVNPDFFLQRRDWPNY